MASKKLSKTTATKPQESKRTDARKSSKSAEYVEDSTDADSDSEEPSSPVRKSKANSDKFSKTSKKEQSEEKAGKVGNKPRKAQKHKTNGVRKKVSSAEPLDSSEISDSDDSSDNARPSGKLQALTVNASQKPRAEKEQSPSSSEGSSDDEDDSDDDSEATAAQDVVMPDARWAPRLAFREGSNVSSEPVRHRSRGAVARQTFTPPAGFKKAVIPKDLSTRSLFMPENLAGKEIWHIVVPQNVPITAVTAASLMPQQSNSKSSKFTPQETVATHKGIDYMLVEEDTPAHGRRAYRPDAGSEQYSVCKPLISRVLQLQCKSLFQFGDNSFAASKDPVNTTVRAPPQQPQGLRMRYQPFGVSSNAHLSRIRQPSELASSLLPSKAQRANVEKRKPSAAASIDASPNATAPMTKRRKHDHSTTEREDSPASVKSEPVDEEPPPAKMETPEERAKLKAERKAEKEERRARKAARRAKREANAAGVV